MQCKGFELDPRIDFHQTQQDYGSLPLEDPQKLRRWLSLGEPQRGGVGTR